MLRIRNRSAAKRRVYIHAAKEGKIVALGDVSIDPGETISLSKKRVLLSTEEDYMRGIIPIYGSSATIVDTLHTITLENERLSPHMKVKLITVRGKIMGMKICKGASIKLTIRSNDVVSAVSEGKVIYTSTGNTPLLLGAPNLDIEGFIKNVANNVIMNNLYGLTFTVCSGCPSSTLKEIQFGNRIASSGSVCLGPTLPLVGCTGLGRVSYDVKVLSLTGLDGLRLTEVSSSPIIATSGGAYRLDFILRLTVGDLTLRMGGTNFSFTSLLYSDRRLPLSGIIVPGPYTVTVRSSVFTAPRNNQLTFSTPNIATSVTIDYNLNVLKNTVRDNVRSTISLSYLASLISLPWQGPRYQESQAG